MTDPNDELRELLQQASLSESQVAAIVATVESIAEERVALERRRAEERVAFERRIAEERVAFERG
jgi:hypothetical protein